MRGKRTRGIAAFRLHILTALLGAVVAVFSIAPPVSADGPPPVETVISEVQPDVDSAVEAADDEIAQQAANGDPLAQAAATCPVGSLCVWEDPEFQSTSFSSPGSISNWTSGAYSSQLDNKDSSWAQRYQSWYWACIYDYDGYVNVTVWLPRGQYLPRAGSGQYPNRGQSNRGLNSGGSC